MSVAEKRATAANRVSGSRPEVLILGLSGPSRVCGTHRLPLGPAAGCRRVLAHRRQPHAVTWRSCALCSRSHPARWGPRSPPCRTSASSSCGALCLRLQSRTRTGRVRRKTASVGAARDRNWALSSESRVLTTGHQATPSRLIIYHPRKFLTWAFSLENA